MIQFEEMINYFIDNKNEDEFIEFEIYPKYVDVVIIKGNKQERHKINPDTNNKRRINSMLKKVRERAEHFQEIEKCQITLN